MLHSAGIPGTGKEAARQSQWSIVDLVYQHGVWSLGGRQAYSQV